MIQDLTNGFYKLVSLTSQNTCDQHKIPFAVKCTSLGENKILKPSFWMIQNWQMDFTNCLAQCLKIHVTNIEYHLQWYVTFIFICAMSSLYLFVMCTAVCHFGLFLVMYCQNNHIRWNAICDVIKQNELELANIDFQIQQILLFNFLCIFCFENH